MALPFHPVSLNAAEPAKLDEVLKPYLAEYGMPAIGAAVVRKGEIVALGVAGTRRAGADIPVQSGDRWHLGSDGKAFTSLLIAIQVEKGTLKWTSTPGEIFPELKAKMDPGFAAMTLRQLLSHTTGLASDKDEFWQLLVEAQKVDANLDAARFYIVQKTCDKPLDHAPDAQFAYSNLGYVVAGAMLERVTGRTWEELLQEQIFAPLDLKSAGIGPQSSVGKVDAPLGHAEVNGKLQAYLAGPQADNPPSVGPAGTAHMSLADFARWASWNAAEGKREPKLVSPETIRLMHTPVIMMDNPNAAPGTPRTGGYGLGWGQLQPEWAGGHKILQHGGSNTKNLAIIYVDTEADTAIVLVTNISNKKANEGFAKLVAVLYKDYIASTK
ncbi:MAG TPA: serine hydrolase domain-containing protein [Candidatus Methylacidiphilales bacterium]|nr:serine hydrolase domain-containing protein [Candidatus Methylacidiphilales bacterium]